MIRICSVRAYNLASFSTYSQYDNHLQGQSSTSTTHMRHSLCCFFNPRTLAGLTASYHSPLDMFIPKHRDCVLVISSADHISLFGDFIPQIVQVGKDLT